MTAIRRLLASLTLLSVLLGTLGWAHPACAPAAGTAATTEMAGMAEMAMGDAQTAPAHAATAPHEGCAQTGGERQSGPGDNHGIPGAGCAAVAHCVVAAPATGAVAWTGDLTVAERPLAAREALPRGPALEPEYPPPRA